MQHGARETSEELKNRAQHILSQRNTSWAVRFNFTLTPTESYTMGHVTLGTSPASGSSALPAVWFEQAQVSPALCLKCPVRCCPVMSTCQSRNEKYGDHELSQYQLRGLDDAVQERCRYK